MCVSALSLNSLHSIHPTAAESQCLCLVSRKSAGLIALDFMLAAPHHPIAADCDANRFGSRRTRTFTASSRSTSQGRIASWGLPGSSSYAEDSLARDPYGHKPAAAPFRRATRTAAAGRSALQKHE